MIANKTAKFSFGSSLNQTLLVVTKQIRFINSPQECVCGGTKENTCNEGEAVVLSSSTRFSE